MSSAPCKIALACINALPTPPSFVLHTGDMSHLSEAGGIRHLRTESSRACRTKDVFYVPGEHDVINDGGKLYRERYCKECRRQRLGLVQLRQKGVHFIGLNQCVESFSDGGLGIIGDEQLDWLEEDVKPLSIKHADCSVRAHSAVGGLSAMGLGNRSTPNKRSDF